MAASVVILGQGSSKAEKLCIAMQEFHKTVTQLASLNGIVAS